MKKLRVTVEGKAYEVLVEMLDESGFATAPRSVAAAASVLAAPVAAAAPTSAAAPAVASGDVPSPLAGKLISIDVKVGDTIAEGAQVATVEAMKMNTFLYAPKAGTVSAILVMPGEGVEEGSALLRIG